ncbi:MAG: ion transporter [Candidatus Scalindua rubra]|uniref:Cyclic nucleotide-gated potassium channel n=1 Tax=Candidatus Scalindua brodae TaxID=237368 RepID=A0A0B0EH46_9BACT|nr:MAG: Cyclic nucleotide-gated potassium channel [Candidatus Scalindua brodae]MBZ0109859.1 ion transporter [Candidatus Scalindua rubra]TWU28723.1 Cyclic nucleotide-gated potassium channel [Candidatus Brocadiaceae bacterium S225]
MSIIQKETVRQTVEQKKDSSWRDVLYEVIFKADTVSGKSFDIAVMVIIALSVITVIINTVGSIEQEYGNILHIAEWVFTIIFTIEYILRLICCKRPAAYARSFFGVVDLFAILPTYISVIIPGSHVLLVIRILRVLRIFRVLKLVKYIGESELLIDALQSSRRKITVFLFSVITIVIIFGSVMYIVESQENGFNNIPQSIYWAVVTLTTVGYGDVTPRTHIGKVIAMIIMVMGYGILAVPTGIVTAEITKAMGHNKVASNICEGCGYRWHDDDAHYCKHCGNTI